MNQQPPTKTSKGLPLLIIVVIIVVIGIGAYVYFMQTEEQGNVNIVQNTNTTVNTNVTSNTNTTGTANWQTYEDTVNGYSLLIPEGYGKNTEMKGYLALDVVTASSATLTFNRIIVTVRDIDMHTHRLGILTSPAADTENMTEEDVSVSGLTANKLTLKNALGETVIHYLISYLGKVYDIETTDSVDQNLIDTFLDNFNITQLDTDVDVGDTNEFAGKACDSNNDCGAYPCVEGVCLIQECAADSDCPNNICGLHATPVPGYCTTIDVL